MQIRVVRAVVQEPVEEAEGGPLFVNEQEVLVVVTDDNELPGTIAKIMLENASVGNIEIRTLDLTSQGNAETLWKLATNDKGLLEGHTDV